ncbi:TonB-dependent receptor|uniref:TonB-dependent Receptor Plug Domain n=2 Tax=Dendrosporobacter quercicolus TaxID=146817 RepID=A0A1G9RTF6_9FIRM|nr:TonB-dependent receptor [Dendrosporobacter quercicolus DSM 1736]SDM26454.1 TonB-dependent Receptor Plug Domain [Dendrosporobacter quercicolus]
MKQSKLTYRALAVSMACTLTFSLNPFIAGIAYAAEEQVQETTEAERAGGEDLQAANEALRSDKPWSTEDFALPAVTVQAPRPDWETKLSPGTVTVIRPEDYKGEQKTLPELLKDVPGVHVRYVSGKGQYTTVTVRGSTAAQVGVFVDGVLSNLGGDAAVDISTIPVKNVERIEVYRGYIPARFGGTYMGGVINVVTKKPEKTNISASVGQSSWGGYNTSLEITEPLGSGSLMVGINHDQSDGDFRYKNPGSDAAYAKYMPGYQAQLVSQIAWTNEYMGYMGVNTDFATVDEVNSAFDNSAVYNQYLSTVVDQYYNYLGFSSKQEVLSVFGWSEQQYYGSAKLELDHVRTSLNNQTEGIRKRIKGLSSDAMRWRRNNDYKNTDALIKWQDDHWIIKGSWKKIDRGMPQPNILTGDITDPSHVSVDLPGFFERKRQKLTTKDLLIGRRDTADNLEWGWQVNYLDQDKDYRNPDHALDGSAERAMGKWSTYDSRRFGGAVDGSYKAGKNHLLEFMTNWSFEKMDIDGSRMEKFDMSDELPNALRYRTYYEQTLFNLQLQDTITLNKAEDLWLTPSVRYNSSKVMGRAAGPNRSAIDPNHRWVKQEDTQTDSKTTWQVALKKKVNEQLTLRSTMGTYYRLLNLYEIAGDGAGIMPRPNTGSDGKLLGGSMFPVPEEGRQWDISAIWDGKFLGADSSNIQLTYFGRKSENLLQLYRFGLDYWSYTNTAKGRVNGVEMQGNFSWNKLDLNLSATYMHTKAREKNDSPTGDNIYYDQPHLYAPDWEGSVRLTYRPDSRTSIFTELKYVDEMYCWNQWPKYVQSSLTTIGLGAKYKIDKDVQVIAGVNDLFDKGPEATFTSKSSYDGSAQNKPVEYPLQGRTYYVTLQYKY